MELMDAITGLAGILTGGGLGWLFSWKSNRRKGNAEASVSETDALVRLRENYERQIDTLLANNDALVQRLSKQNETIDKDRDMIHEERQRTREIGDRLHEAERECNRLNEEKAAALQTIIRLTERVAALHHRETHFRHWFCRKVCREREPEQDPPETEYIPLEGEEEGEGNQQLFDMTVNSDANESDN